MRVLIIFLLVFILYLLVGYLLWMLGMMSFGGTDEYKDYLYEYQVEKGMEPKKSFYYATLISFLFVWPMFLVKRRDK